MTDDLFYCNGINAATGEPLLPPLSPQEIAKVARSETFDSQHLSELKKRWEKANTQHMGLVEGKDPRNLAETGWGVIFAHTYQESTGHTADELKTALSKLLTHRKQQATQKDKRYYQEYIGPKAYRSGESKYEFLKRHRIGPGPANPEKMPYYLLIVGDPESIPYSFQYQLDVQRAVGRIHFETLDEYRQYAHNVVAAEAESFALPKTITFFGPHHGDDKATQLSSKHLLTQLSDQLQKDQQTEEWSVQAVVGEKATKDRLSHLIGGDETPTLLFTASHGIGFDKGDQRQLPYQGALLCQDWPGKKEWGNRPIPNDFYFSCDDVSDDASLLGRIAFNFACYGVGTPKVDEFFQQSGLAAPEIAPYAFVAQLPCRLLQQGVLAVIGHVDRAWPCSFVWGRGDEQLEVFESTLKRLMSGHPVGSAVEFLNERYAELSSDFNELKDSNTFTDDDFEVSNLWAANRDARNYSIIGDPAVRLRVTNDDLIQPASAELPQRISALEAEVISLRKEVKHLQQQLNRLQRNS